MDIEQRVEQLEKLVHDLQLKSLPSMNSISCTSPYHNPYDPGGEIPYKCQYSKYYNREYGWLCPAHTKLQKQIEELTKPKI